MNNFKWSQWSSEIGWAPKGEILIAERKHRVYSPDQPQRRDIGDTTLSCTSDFLSFDALVMFENRYFDELKHLLGNPDFYRSTSSEYSNFFGREAVWFGEANSIHWSLRTALQDQSPEECDSYLLIHRRRQTEAEENRWRSQLTVYLQNLPEPI